MKAFRFMKKKYAITKLFLFTKKGANLGKSQIRKIGSKGGVMMMVLLSRYAMKNPTGYLWLLFAFEGCESTVLMACK